MDRVVPVGRLVPIRLTQVPLIIRRRYGRYLVDQARENLDLAGAVELTRAIERPSDRIYWVPVDRTVEIGVETGDE